MIRWYIPLYQYDIPILVWYLVLSIHYLVDGKGAWVLGGFGLRLRELPRTMYCFLLFLKQSHSTFGQEVFPG